jgi:hypothetical protein
MASIGHGSSNQHYLIFGCLPCSRKQFKKIKNQFFGILNKPVVDIIQ